ncbi:DUF6746 family protein [Alkalimonas sp. NCh-2]|uniref:DUF6746 family protein n=1 Tax=Alkalimonas sp. NCh-2 TaxID=3144846 RepID=UPI0031F6D41E
MRLKIFVCTALLSLSTAVLAHSDRPDHFEGLPANTLTEAVQNFSAYNAKLAELVALDSLTPHQLHEVHQLTYTLENALEKMQAELAELAEVLEEVHVASEHSDGAKVKARGQVYLDTARKLVP